MENVSPIIQALGAFGLGSVLVAVIGVFGARRLNQANAGNVAVQSADTQIENLTNDLTRVVRERDENDEARKKALTKLRGWWERFDGGHAAWDRRQQQRLIDAGVDDPMPPIAPPTDE